MKEITTERVGAIFVLAESSSRRTFLLRDCHGVIFALCSSLIIGTAAASQTCKAKATGRAQNVS
jgi:hypothetical protein